MYYGAVSEIKKEIPDEDYNYLLLGTADDGWLYDHSATSCSIIQPAVWRSIGNGICELAAISFRSMPHGVQPE
jgi:hypothetical protein